MVTVLRRPITVSEARALAGWAYPPPFDLYDGADPALYLHRGDGGEGYYVAVDDADEVVGFAVLGAEARVRGQQARPGVVDVGLGVRPDLTGRGIGGRLLRGTISLAEELSGPAPLRAAVASFNDRSLALCRSAGFRPVRDFPGPGGRPFRELLRRR